MHNELYDWFNSKVLELNEALPLCRAPSALPRQHEFARLEMTHIVVSKRKLKRLVEGGYVEAWDDPRMPTISGMRRPEVMKWALVEIERVKVLFRDL